jgi:hypothetical protein
VDAAPGREKHQHEAAIERARVLVEASEAKL